jgi:hypothetical protein
MSLAMLTAFLTACWLYRVSRFRPSQIVAGSELWVLHFHDLAFKSLLCSIVKFL